MQAGPGRERREGTEGCAPGRHRAARQQCTASNAAWAAMAEQWQGAGWRAQHMPAPHTRVPGMRRRRVRAAGARTRRRIGLCGGVHVPPQARHQSVTPLAAAVLARTLSRVPCAPSLRSFRISPAGPLGIRKPKAHPARRRAPRHRFAPLAETHPRTPAACTSCLPGAAWLLETACTHHHKSCARSWSHLGRHGPGRVHVTKKRGQKKRFPKYHRSIANHALVKMPLAR